MPLDAHLVLRMGSRSFVPSRANVAHWVVQKARDIIRHLGVTFAIVNATEMKTRW